MADLDALARRSVVISSHEGWDALVVTGPDRRTWLQGLITCDVAKLAPGEGTWGLSLNRQGKIQSVVWVVASADALWLGLAPGTANAVELELGRMLIMEDAELEHPDSPQVWLCLHGPDATARAASLAEFEGGHAAPIDWTGLGGAALVVPQAAAARIAESSRSLWLSSDAWTRLRLERGLPEFGIDFDAKDRPHEAALDRRAISWSKGCYLGQEVVCMQDMRGKVQRSSRVLSVTAPPEAALLVGATLSNAAGEKVGAVTSRAYSQLAGSWLVMARLKLEALGGELRCGQGADAWPARPAELI